MIAKIEGILLEIDQETALVQVGPIAYELWLAGYAVSKLGSQSGQDITLYTYQYYEGVPGGGNLTPRMIGFLSREEKAFFELYTTVKGMGIKKALKSLALPIETIAEAIESGDEKMLMTLPGVGKKMGQHMIAELGGKLARYASGTSAAGSQAASGSSSTAFAAYQIEALEILIAWGEKRTDAIDLINLTCSRHPDIKTAEQLVPLAYRIKQGAEV